MIKNGLVRCSVSHELVSGNGFGIPNFGVILIRGGFSTASLAPVREPVQYIAHVREVDYTCTINRTSKELKSCALYRLPKLEMGLKQY